MLKDSPFVYSPSPQNLHHIGHLESLPVHDEPLLAFHLHQSSWRGVVVEAAEWSRIMTQQTQPMARHKCCITLDRCYKLAVLINQNQKCSIEIDGWELCYCKLVKVIIEMKSDWLIDFILNWFNFPCWWQMHIKNNGWIAIKYCLLISIECFMRSTVER